MDHDERRHQQIRGLRDEDMAKDGE